MDPSDLVVGAVYRVSSPYLEVAIWTGEDFIGPELADSGKLQSRHELHYQEGLPFGTCKPIERVGSYVVRPPMEGYNLMVVLEAFEDFILVNKQREKEVDEANPEEQV